MNCTVCDQPLGDPLYTSPAGLSITSLTEIRSGRTEVFACTACGHIQTTPIEDLDDYYESQYRILIDSEDEDQLYKVVDGRQVFRVPHQVDTLQKLIDVPPGARVLDFGCAKGASARRLAETRDDVTVCLFDVSRMYLPFWERFSEPERWATHAIPDAWLGTFDVVMSFFVMEHVEQPVAVLEQMKRLLRPGGHVHFLVPNVFTNTADFVVADHVNHFTASSLTTLLERAGLGVVAIDDRSHEGAWVVIATNGATAAVETPPPPPQSVDELAAYWSELSNRIKSFEMKAGATGPAAVYGSGFYGTFVASCLTDPDRIECFLDQSPYRQGKTLLDKPIIAPDRLPEDVRTIYVGLNPASARSIIDSVESWRDRRHEYLFL